MTFDVGSCWDCPIPISSALLLVALTLLGIPCAGALLVLRPKLLRFLGVLGLLITALFFLLGLEAVRRFGLAWYGDRLLGTDQRFNLAFGSAWVLGVILLSLVTRRLCARVRVSRYGVRRGA